MKLPQIPQDKANHFIYGFVIFLFACLIFNDLISLIIVTFVAIVKELIDKFFKKGTPEVTDAITTILPALILTLNNLIK